LIEVEKLAIGKLVDACSEAALAASEEQMRAESMVTRMDGWLGEARAELRRASDASTPLIVRLEKATGVPSERCLPALPNVSSLWTWGAIDVNSREPGCAPYFRQ